MGIKFSNLTEHVCEGLEKKLKRIKMKDADVDIETKEEFKEMKEPVDKELKT